MNVILKEDCLLECWGGLNETHVQFSKGDTFEDVKELQDQYVKEGDEDFGDIYIPKSSCRIHQHSI